MGYNIQHKRGFVKGKRAGERLARGGEAGARGEAGALRGANWSGSIIRIGTEGYG